MANNTFEYGIVCGDLNLPQVKKITSDSGLEYYGSAPYTTPEFSLLLSSIYILAEEVLLFT